MLPSIQIGPLALPTFPLLLILGLYLGLWLAARVATRRGIAGDHLYNAGFYAGIAALLAGRLGHVVLFFPAYRADALSVLSPNLAAFQPLAAALAALVALAWYRRSYRVPAVVLADALMTGALLALAAMALAEGLNGYNYGAPAALPWAITQWSVARHPVQFYELTGALLVAGAIWRGLPRLAPGQAALAAIGGYAAVRLFVDAFRDQPAIIGPGFRLTQVIALVALILALLAFYQSMSPAQPRQESVVLDWERG